MPCLVWAFDQNPLDGASQDPLEFLDLRSRSAESRKMRSGQGDATQVLPQLNFQPTIDEDGIV